MLAALPHCRIGRFGSKGFALLVRYQGEDIPSIYPPDESIKEPIVEFKGDGDNITVPPSLHAKTGKPYIWLNPETGEAIDVLPPVEELPILNSSEVERVREALKPYSRAPKKRERMASGGTQTKTGRHAAYFKAGFERETDALAKLHLNEGRPSEFFRAVCRVGWGVHHGFIGRAEFAQGFIDACDSNGLLARDGARAIEATIRSGLRLCGERPVAGAGG